MNEILQTDGYIPLGSSLNYGVFIIKFWQEIFWYRGFTLSKGNHEFIKIYSILTLFNI